MLRLPKDIQNHPRRAELEAYLQASLGPLSASSTVQVSHLGFDGAVSAAAEQAGRRGHLVQGLENISTILDKERDGLIAIQEKLGQPPAQRMSRLLLLANDGSQRFCRHAETLLTRHGDRLHGVLLDADAARLGQLLSGSGRQVKALMLADRKALGQFLIYLAEHQRLGRQLETHSQA